MTWADQRVKSEIFNGWHRWSRALMRRDRQMEECPLHKSQSFANELKVLHSWMIEVVGNYAAADRWPLALEGNSLKTSQTNPKGKWPSQPFLNSILIQKKEKQQKPKWQASVDQQYLHYLFQEVESSCCWTLIWGRHVLEVLSISAER